MSSQPPQTDRAVTIGPLWGPRYPPRWLLPFVAVMTLLAAISVTLAGSTREPDGAGVFLLFAALFGHLAGYGVYLRWIPLRRGPAMPDDHLTGTSFRYAKWAYYWYVAPIVLAVLGLALFAVLSFPDNTVFATVLLSFCLLAAVAIGFMVYLAPGRLTLTPDGVHHRGLTLVQYSPWSSIVAVVAIESGHERTIVVEVDPGEDDRLRHYLPRGLRSVHPLLPSIVVSDTWLLTDPTLVHETLRHYLGSPEDRAELGTRAAVDRVRHRRFTRGDAG
ncbi:MAG TPA: hypothetical protein VN408_08105 [Actinoplanes sp.]|nr:hypothetical protein [Actinoplanes sp.]